MNNESGTGRRDAAYINDVRLLMKEESACIDKASAIRQADQPEKWLGLALSGGGIRSASFALGILQALDAWHLFKRVDYLSTVSGGGYIGASLSYFLHKENNKMAKEGTFPFGKRGQYGARTVLRNAEMGRTPQTDAVSPEPAAIISFIRQHAHYLTPSRRLGWPQFIATAIRAAFTSLIVYFPLLLAAAILLALSEFWIGQLPLVKAWTETGRLSPYDCLTAAFIAIDPPGPFCGVAGTGAVRWFNWPLVLLVVVLAISIGNAIWFSAWTNSAARASRAAQANPTGEEESARRPSAYPKTMIGNTRFNGWLLNAFGTMLVLSILPWVVSLFNQGINVIATASISTLVGYIGTFWEFRNRLKGSTSGDSLFAQAKPIVFAALSVFGLLVLAFGIAEKIVAFHGADTPVWLGAASCVVLVAISCGLARIGNLNYVSQHRMYRDRLMEAFCPSDKAVKNLKWEESDADRFGIGDCLPATGAAMSGPYHLINTALVIPDSEKTVYRSRSADNFILSPLYCGSNATGWRKTPTYMNGAMTLPTAMAISGAALNAHSGCGQRSATRDGVLSFLLTLFGAQLGYWAPHPAQDESGQKAQPNFLRPGWRGLFGKKLDEDKKRGFVQLSDGGHFENLGLYELVRRRVDVIIVSDAGQDKDFVFEDLGIAVERVRVDYGANIEFANPDHGLMHILAGTALADKKWCERYDLATRGYAVARIDYPEIADPVTDEVVFQKKSGYLLFFKATLIDGLPMDLYAYKKLNADFPDQTTVDQDFDEYQFEAYRELGYRLASQFFIDKLGAGAKKDGKDKEARMEDLFCWLEQMAAKPAPSAKNPAS